MTIYTGQDCENDTDGCAASPCAQGRNCTDINAEDEAVLGRGYNCSDCPAGYIIEDEKCEGNKKPIVFTFILNHEGYVSDYKIFKTVFVCEKCISYKNCIIHIFL